LLLCAAVLALAVIGPLFRSDAPPKWTTYGWVGEFVTLAIVCALALGVTALGAGAIAAYQTDLDYLDLGLLAGFALLAVAARRWWKARARPRALQAEPSLSVLVSDSRDTSGRGPAAPAERAKSRPSRPRRPHRAA
jgi:hypothetical protein